MNFDKAFKNYTDGVPTKEEKEFVENEIAKAKALSNLLDDEGINVKPAAIIEADKDSIKKAKMSFKVRMVILGVTCILSVLIILASVLGGVFGAASKYASDKIVYDRYTCGQIALDYVVEKGASHGIVKEDLEILDIDADFEYEVPIKQSFYAYKVLISNMENGKTYWIYVHTITGDSIFLW